MADILNGISSVITEVGEWVVSVLSNISAIFYTPGTTSGTGTFTFLGTLILVAFGLSMVWVAINFIRKLVSRG